jgi:hypothetical protein
MAQVSNEFYVGCVNRLRRESESHIATGCAKFDDALITVGSMGQEFGDRNRGKEGLSS